MSLSTARMAYVYVGNPGCGKSTLGNIKAGKVVFGAGISLGEGFTKRLDVQMVDGVAYVDTPGLADARLRTEAAKAISEAFKAGGCFKVIFVCKEDAGRARAQDITTMKMVLEACDEIEENKFGIIVNMCPKGVMKRLADKSNNITFCTVLQESLPRKTQFVLFLPNDGDLEAEDNAFVQINKLPNYAAFLDALPQVTITPGKARDVKADEFDALNAKMEEKDAQIKELLSKAEAKDAEAMKKLKEMHDKYEQKLEELQRKSGSSWTPLNFVCDLVGHGARFIADAFVPGSGKSVKRTVDGIAKSLFG